MCASLLRFFLVISLLGTLALPRIGLAENPSVESLSSQIKNIALALSALLELKRAGEKVVHEIDHPVVFCLAEKGFSIQNIGACLEGVPKCDVAQILTSLIKTLSWIDWEYIQVALKEAGRLTPEREAMLKQVAQIAQHMRGNFSTIHTLLTSTLSFSEYCAIKPEPGIPGIVFNGVRSGILEACRLSCPSPRASSRLLGNVLLECMVQAMKQPGNFSVPVTVQPGDFNVCNAIPTSCTINRVEYLDSSSPRIRVEYVFTGHGRLQEIAFLQGISTLKTLKDEALANLTPGILSTILLQASDNNENISIRLTEIDGSVKTCSQFRAANCFSNPGLDPLFISSPALSKEYETCVNHPILIYGAFDSSAAKGGTATLSVTDPAAGNSSVIQEPVDICAEGNGSRKKICGHMLQPLSKAGKYEFNFRWLPLAGGDSQSCNYLVNNKDCGNLVDNTDTEGRCTIEVTEQGQEIQYHLSMPNGGGIAVGTILDPRLGDQIGVIRKRFEPAVLDWKPSVQTLLPSLERKVTATVFRPTGEKFQCETEVRPTPSCSIGVTAKWDPIKGGHLFSYDVQANRDFRAVSLTLKHGGVASSPTRYAMVPTRTWSKEDPTARESGRWPDWEVLGSVSDLNGKTIECTGKKLVLVDSPMTGACQVKLAPWDKKLLFRFGAYFTVETELFPPTLRNQATKLVLTSRSPLGQKSITYDTAKAPTLKLHPKFLSGKTGPIPSSSDKKRYELSYTAQYYRRDGTKITECDGSAWVGPQASCTAGYTATRDMVSGKWRLVYSVSSDTFLTKAKFHLKRGNELVLTKESSGSGKLISWAEATPIEEGSYLLEAFADTVLGPTTCSTHVEIEGCSPGEAFTSYHGCCNSHHVLKSGQCCLTGKVANQGSACCSDSQDIFQGSCIPKCNAAEVRLGDGACCPLLRASSNACCPEGQYAGQGGVCINVVTTTTRPTTTTTTTRPTTTTTTTRPTTTTITTRPTTTTITTRPTTTTITTRPTTTTITTRPTTTTITTRPTTTTTNRVIPKF